MRLFKWLRPKDAPSMPMYDVICTLSGDGFVTFKFPLRDANGKKVRTQKIVKRADNFSVNNFTDDELKLKCKSINQNIGSCFGIENTSYDLVFSFDEEK